MGKPKTCNPCCGGGVGSSSSSSIPQLACNACLFGVAPSRWTFTIAGVTPNAVNCPAPSGCNDINRTVIVPYNTTIANACNWTYTFDPGYSPCGVNVDFGYRVFATNGGGHAFGNWKLVVLVNVSTGTEARWEKSFGGPFNCLSEYTLTKVTDGARCSTWPSTLLLSPAP